MIPLGQGRESSIADLEKVLYPAKPHTIGGRAGGASGFESADSMRRAFLRVLNAMSSDYRRRILQPWARNASAAVDTDNRCRPHR